MVLRVFSRPSGSIITTFGEVVRNSMVRLHLKSHESEILGVGFGDLCYTVLLIAMYTKVKTMALEGRNAMLVMYTPLEGATELKARS